SPERNAHGDFAAAQSATREKQIRDVGARDKQDEADRAEKNKKIDAEVHADHPLVRKEIDTEAVGKIFGKVAVEILSDERVVGSEFGWRDPGLEPREHVDIFAVAGSLSDERERSPQVRSAGIGRARLTNHGKSPRHHADNGERLPVKKDGLAD